jgi:hypothetical protein
MNKNNIRIAAVGIAVVVLAIGTYLAYEKYTRRTHVVAMVEDAALRMRATLQVQAGGVDPADGEANATAVEAYASTLRSMNTSSFAPLAAAADDYLGTVREIMRRTVNIRLSKARLAVSADALASHMRADSGGSDWPRVAVQLKQPVDADLREYRIAVESYASLMSGLAASQEKIAPYVDASVLTDERLIGEARKRTLDAYAATEQNVRQTTNLGSYRGSR